MEAPIWEIYEDESDLSDLTSSDEESEEEDQLPDALTAPLPAPCRPAVKTTTTTTATAVPAFKPSVGVKAERKTKKKSGAKKAQDGDGVNGKREFEPMFRQPRTCQYAAKFLHEWIKEGQVDLNPDYQRDVVWPEHKQCDLIDSAYHNIAIPPVLFAVHMDADGLAHRICIDGKQRLTSFYRRTGRVSYYVARPGNEHKLMPAPARKRLESVQMVCSEYDGIQDWEQREIFQRVQLGMPLSRAERIQALNGPYPDLVRNALDHFRMNICCFFQHLPLFKQPHARDFKTLAQIVFVIFNSPLPPLPSPASSSVPIPGTGSTPSSTRKKRNPKKSDAAPGKIKVPKVAPRLERIEAFLHKQEAVSEALKKDVMQAISIFVALLLGGEEDDPTNTNTKAKKTQNTTSGLSLLNPYSPTLFVMMMFIIHTKKRFLSFSELLDTLLALKKHAKPHLRSRTKSVAADGAIGEEKESQASKMWKDMAVWVDDLVAPPGRALPLPLGEGEVWKSAEQVAEEILKDGTGTEGLAKLYEAVRSSGVPAPASAPVAAGTKRKRERDSGAASTATTTSTPARRAPASAPPPPPPAAGSTRGAAKAKATATSNPTKPTKPEKDATISAPPPASAPGSTISTPKSISSGIRDLTKGYSPAEYRSLLPSSPLIPQGGHTPAAGSGSRALPPTTTTATTTTASVKKSVSQAKGVGQPEKRPAPARPVPEFEHEFGREGGRGRERERGSPPPKKRRTSAANHQRQPETNGDGGGGTSSSSSSPLLRLGSGPDKGSVLPGSLASAFNSMQANNHEETETDDVGPGADDDDDEEDDDSDGGSSAIVRPVRRTGEVSGSKRTGQMITKKAVLGGAGAGGQKGSAAATVRKTSGSGSKGVVKKVAARSSGQGQEPQRRSTAQTAGSSAAAPASAPQPQFPPRDVAQPPAPAPAPTPARIQAQLETKRPVAPSASSAASNANVGVDWTARPPSFSTTTAPEPRPRPGSSVATARREGGGAEVPSPLSVGSLSSPTWSDTAPGPGGGSSVQTHAQVAQAQAHAQSRPEPQVQIQPPVHAEARGELPRVSPVQGSCTKPKFSGGGSGSSGPMHQVAKPSVKPGTAHSLNKGKKRTRDESEFENGGAGTSGGGSRVDADRRVVRERDGPKKKRTAEFSLEDVRGPGSKSEEGVNVPDGEGPPRITTPTFFFTAPTPGLSSPLGPELSQPTPPQAQASSAPQPRAASVSTSTADVTTSPGEKSRPPCMADVLHTPKLPSAPIPKYTQGTTPTASSGSTTQVGQTTQRRGQAPPQQRVPAEVQVLSRQMTQPLMQQREPTRDPRKKPQQLPPASALPRPTTQQEESPRPLRTAPAPAQSPSNSTTRAPQTPLRPQSQPQPRVSVAQTPERQTGFILGLGTSPQDAQNFDSEAHLHAELDSLITLMTPDRTNPVKRSSLDEGRSGAGSTGSGTPAKAAQAARPLGAGGRTAPVERGSVGGSSGSAHKATSFGAPQGGGSKRPRESSEEINGWLMKELKLKGFSEEEARAEVQRLQRLNRPAEQPQRSSQVTPAPGQANTDPTPRETANRPSPNSSTLHRQSSNQGGGSSRSGI
ncbi:hypothetical protein AX16_002278 [Volvariella volvacea WC 439]|nr:hypothetical protein AX16_002278 [Volvariella volvacea WC 439]